MPTIRSTSAPTAAVSTSSRAHPQGRLLLGLRCMSTAVTVEAISTDMSVSMWPASTSSASDPVTMALTTSAMNTVEVSPNDIMSLFWCSAPLAAVVASTPAWLCAMMGFLSSSFDPRLLKPLLNTIFIRLKTQETPVRRLGFPSSADSLAAHRSPVNKVKPSIKNRTGRRFPSASPRSASGPRAHGRTPGC